MKLHIFTLVLNGEPFIEHHLREFEKLDLDWTWSICHGRAANAGSTRWCKSLKPTLSKDGTTEYLHAIAGHPRVVLNESSYWAGGKDAMCAAAIHKIKEPCVLMQVDSDEQWSHNQLTRIVDLFSFPHIQRAYFKCRYFIGPDIITTGENCYGANPGEWLRAWRFQPGMKWNSHEPPALAGNHGIALSREFTAREGLIFDHMAYVTEAQVAEKERFYGYPGAVAAWKRLQQNKKWPVKRLKDYFPWVDDRVGANRITL